MSEYDVAAAFLGLLSGRERPARDILLTFGRQSCAKLQAFMESDSTVVLILVMACKSCKPFFAANVSQAGSSRTLNALKSMQKHSWQPASWHAPLQGNYAISPAGVGMHAVIRLQCAVSTHVCLCTRYQPADAPLEDLRACCTRGPCGAVV